MPFVDLPLNDGNRIPALAFGSGSVNKQHDIHENIEQAIEVGFSHLDTAQAYGNEESVGLAIKESGLDHSQLFVTSKFAQGDIQEAVSTSLSKLGIKYLDLYLIHVPQVVSDIGYEAAWKAFEKIKADGLAKSIGVSNFKIKDLQEIMKIATVKPAVNQIPLNPYNYADNKELLEYHARHGIVTEAYSSLVPITTYPGGPVDTPIREAATRRGVSPTQIVFAWVRAKGAVIVTTSSNKQHMKEYVAVGDIEPLTGEEVAAIDAAAAKGPPTLRGSIFARLSNILLTCLTMLALISLIKTVV